MFPEKREMGIMEKRFGKAFSRLEELEDEMVEMLKECIRIRAIGPKNEGEGETEKADYILGKLEEFGIEDVERIDVPDGAVPSGSRPNIIARYRGSAAGEVRRTLWFITHMDVVPAGDLDLWETDPFEPVVKDGKVFGRGAEDNGQDLVASIFTLRVLKELGLDPEHDIACLISADEETGSEFGLKHIIEHRSDLFKESDLVVVPDAPTPHGAIIEVAEKSILWIRVRTRGQQAHGSNPDRGINAHRAAAKFITMVDEELYDRFDKKIEMYSPPVSTFEVTKKETNVPSVNIIPGEDVVYFDNRVLPEYDLEEVIEVYRDLAGKVESEKGVRMDLEIVMRDDAAPPTDPEDDISRLTKRCVEGVYGVRTRFEGIGGGTYAAIFRRAGVPAVVWGKGDDIAHQPNEYALSENMVGDAKVFLAMALTPVPDKK